MKDRPLVSVIGLGKLGVCMAGAFASKGFETVGVDIHKRTIDLVNQGEPPVIEPGLKDLLKDGQEKLRATDDYSDAITNSDVTFIIVPTDSNADGAFSIQLLRDSARRIGEILAKKDTYHLVVITSTVLPGSCEHGVAPVLEEASGKKCGEDFGLCYSPEFIALGSVIRDFLNPDFLLVGEWDERSGEMLEDIYGMLVGNDSPVARMSLANAELAKISLNAYVTTKITFANMLAEICERIPGGDVDAVTGALGLDKRIGSKFFRGALGYGGTCFPRDNKAFTYLMSHLGLGSDLAQTIDRLNRSHAGRLADIVLSRLSEGDKVAVLGLAFKPNTPVVVESQSVELARILSAKGANVAVYDPVAMKEARAELGEAVTYSSSAADCLEGANVAVIATAWQEFESLPLAEETSTTVIDGWRILKNPGPNYLAVGREIDASMSGSTLPELVAKIVKAG